MCFLIIIIFPLQMCPGVGTDDILRKMSMVNLGLGCKHFKVDSILSVNMNWSPLPYSNSNLASLKNMTPFVLQPRDLSCSCVSLIGQRYFTLQFTCYFCVKNQVELSVGEDAKNQADLGAI